MIPRPNIEYSKSTLDVIRQDSRGKKSNNTKNIMINEVYTSMSVPQK